MASDVRIIIRGANGVETPVTVGVGYAHLAAVTPNDSTDLTTAATGGLYVGTGGDVKVTTVGGEAVVLYNVPSSGRIDVQVARVWSTGTTAAAIVAIY